ncbi:membrane protein [Streptomyces sp. AS58]|nr:membrane protein [Streptomyces sp. AS58]
MNQKPKDGSDGLLQPFNVTDKDGVPISSYTVKTDTGGWKDIDLKIWNIVAQLLFGVSKWIIGFTCWLIKWALNFGLAKVMVGPVEDISSTIKNQVIDRLGLPGLFLTFAGFYCGWLILFKERSRGFAEIGVSLVVAALSTTVLVSPAQVLLGQHDQPQPQGSTMLLSEGGLLGKSKDFTLEVASIVLADDPASAKGSADPNNVAKPITDALVEAFIVKPNQLMVYGQTFDGQCDKAFREFKLAEFNLDQLGMNYWDAAMMDSIYDTNFIGQLTENSAKFEAACVDVKPKAKRASADLAFSALFVAIAAVIVAILMILVTGTFLTAQGWLAFEAIRGHWALTAGILPGGGRATLWRWCSAITKAVLGIIIAILFLAIFILIVLALIDADTGDVLAVKFIVIDVTAVAGLAGHKRIKQTAQSIAVNLNRKLANARVGGSRRSVFNSPGRYAETAPGLKQMWGEARGEARRVSRPVGQGLKAAKNAWVGSPQANRKASRLRSAARLATNAAAAVGTGGASAAAKVAAQQAAKQTLKKRLATAAANKMSQTRGGRATMATGKAAAATAKYGAKATKFAFMATVGAPVGIPRGVAATKRGAAAATARAGQVRDQLKAVKERTVDKKVQEAKDFGAEYKRNVATASKFVAKQGTKAQVNLGLAQIQSNPRAAAPPGPRTGAIAPKTPGGAPTAAGTKTPGKPASTTAGTKTPGSVKPPAAGPTAVPKMPTPPTPAPPTPPAASTPAKPPAPPRAIRRATRPPGPPRPRP